MKLAESTQVSASEDIYDAHGTKLLAKGAAIAPAMKERLVRHKLRKPLETSLSVADGLTAATVLAEAKALLDEVPALKVFMGDKQAAIFETLADLSLHPVAALLLTVAERSREGAFRHGVLVALISVALGAHQRLPHNVRAILASAGLLHDIGELYIQPDFFRTQRPLRPEEWKHVAAHPRIGQIVLDELTDYPRSVIDAIAGHHERLDGSGYPRQLAGDQISAEAQVLSMAEALSGIIVRQDDVLIRSCLALKCVPGEHPRSLISVFSTLRRNYSGTPLPVGSVEAQSVSVSKTQEVVKTLAHAFAECEKISLSPSLPKIGSQLLERVMNRLEGLGQALKATGIEVCFENGYLPAFAPEDREIFLEIDVVGHEISWRLRDIARDLYLRLENLAPEAAAVFADLIGILDNPVNA
ncbi:MAG: HD domain-containing protein [Sulfuricella sp.]|nr:HD domain-containing protein [Sulfuricella sp.]